MTTRQAMLYGGVAVLGLAAVVSALAGFVTIAVAVLAVLVTGVLLGLVDLRRRNGATMARLKRVATKQDKAQAALVALESDVRRVRQTTVKAANQAARRSDIATLSGGLTALREAMERTETGSERVVAALGQERLAAEERQLELARLIADEVAGLARRADHSDEIVTDVREALLTQVAQVEERQTAVANETRGTLRRLSWEPVQQIQALLQLMQRVPTGSAPLPELGGWAVQPTTLLRLLTLVEQRRPHLVVECGSGSSTVWLARALRELGGDRRVVALEHDAEYAGRTRRAVEAHGLTDWAEVLTAPLTEIATLGEGVRWYDPSAIENLSGIDLLVVDGPPKATGPMARYPAVPLLGDRLSDNAHVLMDDTDRRVERDAVDRWLEELPGLERLPEEADRSVLLTYRRLAGGRPA